MIIATGAEYRQPALENLSRFEGAGVYYGATPMEAQLCVGEEVIVVGGGNSAGQAAVFLRADRHAVCTCWSAATGLAETMSRYLIRRIEENPAIVLRTRTEIVALEGTRHLERVRWRDDRTGAVETHDIRHVLHDDWRRARTRAGSMAASRSTTRASSRPARTCRATIWRPRSGRWRGRRICSRPAGRGIFAVGDVRGGNVKRVASAVGEGSIAIAFVHQVLQASRCALTRRTRQPLDARRDDPRVEPDVHRRDRRQRRAAGAAGRPARDDHRRAVGDRSLRAVPRRADSGRRIARRSVRPQARLSRRRRRSSRSRRSCCGLATSPAMLIAGRALAGHRRGVSRARQPGDHQRDVRRRRARPGDRHLVGIQRDHHGDRAGHRRLADRARQLARGVLPERAARRRSCCAVAAVHGREPRPVAHRRASTGPARRSRSSGWAASVFGLLEWPPLGASHPLVIGSLAIGVVRRSSLLVVVERRVAEPDAAAGAVSLADRSRWPTC